MTDSIYDTRLLRQQNLSRILKTIRATEGISRADLSRHFGMSRSSVSSLTDQLSELGVVREAHLAASSGGRPPRVLQLQPNSCMVLGVDLGSSHIAVLSMNLGGEIESMSEVQLDCQNQPQQALHRIVEMVNALRTDRPLLGVGVAVPCPVVEGNLSEQILPAWKGIHLQSALEGMLGVQSFRWQRCELGCFGRTLVGQL